MMEVSEQMRNTPTQPQLVLVCNEDESTIRSEHIAFAMAVFSSGYFKQQAFERMEVNVRYKRTIRIILVTDEDKVRREDKVRL